MRSVVRNGNNSNEFGMTDAHAYDKHATAAFALDARPLFADLGSRFKQWKAGGRSVKNSLIIICMHEFHQISAHYLTQTAWSTKY